MTKGYATLTEYKDEKRADEIWKDISKKKRFIERVDDRDTDPDYTQEQLDKEYEKYKKYEKEIEKLQKELNSLVVTRKKVEIVI